MKKINPKSDLIPNVEELEDQLQLLSIHDNRRLQSNVWTFVKDGFPECIGDWCFVTVYAVLGDSRSYTINYCPQTKEFSWPNNGSPQVKDVKCWMYRPVVPKEKENENE